MPGSVSHPFSLLVGLNLGPNLCVTGSLAWLASGSVRTTTGPRWSRRCRGCRRAEAMNAVDEQHVRERLQDALGNIEVPRVPGQAIVGRGRRLRWQRRAGTAAGLAVLVALGVSLPQLGSEGTITRAPAGPAGGQVVVDAPPAAPAVDGVIASGTTSGVRWRIRLGKENGSLVADAP
jgi:hypothetical protein